jgi:hypothetical protein
MHVRSAKPRRTERGRGRGQATAAFTRGRSRTGRTATGTAGSTRGARRVSPSKIGYETELSVVEEEDHREEDVDATFVGDDE